VPRVKAAAAAAAAAGVQHDTRGGNKAWSERAAALSRTSRSSRRGLAPGRSCCHGHRRRRQQRRHRLAALPR
jgi:hypothetical protein